MMQRNRDLASCCDVDCTPCEERSGKCAGGHSDQKGRALCFASIGPDIRPLCKFCVGEKGYARCGIFADFSCSMTCEMRDPSLPEIDSPENVAKQSRGFA